MYRRLSYLLSGSGCRAATTPPRAAAERLARTAPFGGSLCAAGRGATRRSATSSATVNRYSSLRIPETFPSPIFRQPETRDRNVPRTRRQECLRYGAVQVNLGCL